ncbi:aspartate/glutamate racemase family protein [Fusobacterium sp.]|uniref:aspartate/glutamate racemase family protein n=1 Tax=Fusobacterium sp. TaxID=68766 RepID=UPI0028FFB508|nr:aspartate/glutamate racemase family protein [Fusobacterium sp.]MDU1910591.1 aspartate/glutamate racemase family protein [Fusobacterium sp.]
MKTIGLIGGMSWESTVTYYEIINRTIKEKLGGLHSGKLVLFSVDFQEIEECQAKGEWNKSAEILTEAAQNLEKAGADFVVICTNTMHKIAPDIQRNINIPILHIAEATADELDKKEIKKVALLGTKYTMEQEFYKNKLTDRGIEVVIPDDEDRVEVNRVIYEELCLGKILPLSKKRFLDVMDKLVKKGAQGVILGCTEIGLLVQQKDTIIPLFDTAAIHAERAALKSIKE